MPNLFSALAVLSGAMFLGYCQEYDAGLIAFLPFTEQVLVTGLLAVIFLLATVAAGRKRPRGRGAKKNNILTRRDHHENAARARGIFGGSAGDEFE